MAQIHVKTDQSELAKTNLQDMFQDEFIQRVLNDLNPGQIRILNECWEQLHKDLLKYEPDTISVRLFMLHFNNYAT
jgi:hypothetical protein